MGKYSRDRSSVPIYVGPYIIGHVSCGTFLKRVRGSKHFLADPRAIAFSEQSLDDAERAGAQEIEVTDTETMLRYSTSLAFFKGHSFEVERAGFERQRAMRLEHWNVRAPKRSRRSAAGSSPIAPEPQVPEPKADPLQLNLFR